VDYIAAEIRCELICVDVRARARSDALGLPDEKHPMAAEHSNKKRSEAQRQQNAMRANRWRSSQPSRCAIEGQRRRCRPVGSAAGQPQKKRTPGRNLLVIDSACRQSGSYNVPWVAPNSASESFASWSEPQPVRSPSRSYIISRIACRHWRGREYATEYDTDQNLACRSPAAPKGWEDMPARLASAEITDPAVSPRR